MSNVSIEFATPGAGAGDITFRRAHVDGHVLNFDSSGKADLQADPGTHSLTWFIEAAPGVGYHIAITSPAEVAFKHSGTIGADLKDGGLHWFTLS